MERPDFTGKWKFNREKSALEIPYPDSTLFCIEHHDPRFHFERTHVTGNTQDVFIIDLTTDGSLVTRNHHDIEIQGRLYWDSDVLVFDSQVCHENVRGRNLVRYHLSENGQTLTADERLTLGEHTHHNKWIFEKT